MGRWRRMSCCLPEQAEKSCDLGNFPKSTAPLKGHFTCGCLHRMPITDFHLAQQEDNQTAGAALARSRVAAWLQAVGVRTFKKDHPPSTSSIGVTWQRERKEKRAKATTKVEITHATTRIGMLTYPTTAAAIHPAAETHRSHIIQPPSNDNKYITFLWFLTSKTQRYFACGRFY